MCGIFGIISDKQINKKEIVEVSNVISHRGPDDEGYLLFNNETLEYCCASGKDSIKKLSFPKIESIPQKYNSAFLHRRLSIIDLSKTGHQPMSYDNGNLWIILNGEVYNYIELKEELTTKGYNFKSTSDTEVVLAAYLEWGEDCVTRFNGMWAFAIWDRKNNHIFLSRDRVGIKPLYYYYHNNNIFIFSSEIKGIRTYLENCLKLSERRIYEYLIRGQNYIGATDNTIYNEVKKLMPGRNLIYNNKEIFINRYWNLKLNNNNLSFSENVEKFKMLFSESIKYRLRSDVEVGACLSGGLDSSSIVSFSSSNYKNKFNTFSAIWPGNKCDESYYVDKVNNKYMCNAHAFTPNLDNIIEVIEKEIWHLEIPFAGSSLLAQWFVMEKAKEKNIKVLLDGQGADEILSGYPSYIIPYINEMIYSFKWAELIKYYQSLKENGYNFRRFISIQKHRYFDKYHKTAFPIKKELVGKYSFYKKYSTPHKCKYLPDYLLDHIENSNLPALLHFEDRNSMAHSVESRVPFLDHKLMEFTVNVPTEQKIHGALTKTILRESMKLYLPVEIYKRKDKIGFSTPIESNLFYKDSYLFKYAINYVKNSELSKMKIIDEELIDDNNIFAIYTLAKFIEMWS